MNLSAKNKAMLLSFLRVLLGCFVAAYSAVAGVEPPWTLSSDDWLKIGNALWGASLVTAVNFFRKGETRFGTGAKDAGMGGEDTVTPPDGQIITPEGPVDAPVEMLDPQPVEEPVEEPEFVEDPVEEAEIQPLVRSIPIAEARKAAKKIPAKRAPRKQPPKTP